MVSFIRRVNGFDMQRAAPNAELVRVGDEFYIHPASSFADDRTRVLKHGETFAVFDRFGDVFALGKGEQGLYHEGTRYLSRSTLLLDGRRPLLLSSSVSLDNVLLTVDLANAPDDREDAVEQEVVHLLRTKFLWNGTCHERLHLHNYGGESVEVELEYEFESDFADIFEVRGIRRRRRGARRLPELEPAAAVLRYDGLDGVARTTRISFSRAPDELTPTAARFRCALAPGEALVIHVTVGCVEAGETAAARPAYGQALGSATEELRVTENGRCVIEASNAQFDEWVTRSQADLQMMVTETPHGPYVYAGVPWFNAPFGRDGLITALEALWARPDIAAGVLRVLAATQATREDSRCDAEPGKILHEARRGEMAATGEVPFREYYGSVDATPLFVILAGEYYRATADQGLICTIWPNIERALQWIDRYGDPDQDGFVEYARRTPDGLINQGWKDSSNSVFHADGSDVEGPIALCEVQGYVYAAKQHAAQLAAVAGTSELSASLEREAELLRQRFDEAFWCEELGTYALALDGRKDQCRVRTSNPGHCLFTGIALPERAGRVAETLLGPDSFSSWGIRTLAVGEARYNPMSYHNGSIWPHDNALAAEGLGRYGFKQHAARIMTGMFDASLFVDLYRLPELFCGFARREHEGPTLYPVACSPQAWAAATPFMLLKAVLGLTLDAPRHELRFEYPELPPFLQELHIRGLRVGDATISVAIQRHPTDVGITVTERVGDVNVVLMK